MDKHCSCSNSIEMLHKVESLLVFLKLEALHVKTDDECSRLIAYERPDEALKKIAEIEKQLEQLKDEVVKIQCPELGQVHIDTVALKN